MAVGSSAPAAGGGVGSEGLGVDALGGEHCDVAGVGAEAAAVFAYVCVAADSLGRGAQAAAACEAALDGEGVAPVGADGFDGNDTRSNTCGRDPNFVLQRKRQAPWRSAARSSDHRPYDTPRFELQPDTAAFNTRF